MRFWEVLFDIISIILIPKKIKVIRHNGERNVRVTFLVFMPWARAFVVGSNIFTTYSKEEFFGDKRHILAHELVHVDQWRETGFWFPFKYLAASIRAGFKHGSPYRMNPYEIVAHEVEEEVRFSESRQRGN